MFDTFYHVCLYNPKCLPCLALQSELMMIAVSYMCLYQLILFEMSSSFIDRSPQRGLCVAVWILHNAILVYRVL